MFDVILEEVMSGSLLAPVPDDNGGASNDFPLVTLGVQLAKSGIFAQLHVVRNSQKWDLMFLTQSLDQLLIHGLVAVIRQNAEQSLKFK
jgi:hypothetical protein